METKDIKRIEELVNEINEIHGNCLKVKKLDYEVEIRHKFAQTFYSTYIDNIIKYTEATKNNWFISVDEQGLYLHLF